MLCLCFIMLLNFVWVYLHGTQEVICQCWCKSRFSQQSIEKMALTDFHVNIFGLLLFLCIKYNVLTGSEFFDAVFSLVQYPLNQPECFHLNSAWTTSSFHRSCWIKSILQCGELKFLHNTPEQQNEQVLVRVKTI